MLCEPLKLQKRVLIKMSLYKMRAINCTLTHTYTSKCQSAAIVVAKIIDVYLSVECGVAVRIEDGPNKRNNGT